VICGAEVTALRHDGGGWLLGAGGQRYTAPVVVDAAGRVADAVARLAGVATIGLTPRRRSAFTFARAGGSGYPALAAGRRHRGGLVLQAGRGNAARHAGERGPVEPHDVQPEELDIATGIHRIEQMTTLEIRRPARTWAGLRSFVADGDLVGGFDPVAPGFFWLAAQGGYGIQTSRRWGKPARRWPAASRFRPALRSSD